MEGCLLCLEIDKDFVECIKVDSTQWQELNIKTLIEKHLWIMESIQSTSWLCQICWQALSDFHKFYMRIEEAHLDFGKLMKRENEPDVANDLKDLPIFDDKVLFESHLEPEILMDQLMMEEDKTIVKEEPNEELADEENEPLIPRRKRKCSSKDAPSSSNNETINQDPLEKPKKSKSSKAKAKKKEPNVELSVTKESTDIAEVATLAVKQDPDTLEIQNIFNLSPNSSGCEDFDFNTDLEYQPEEEEVLEKPKRAIKKKTPRKQNATATDDINSDGNGESKEKSNKPDKKSKKKKKSRKNKNSESEDTDDDDDTKQHHEQSHKERNQFLADNFKMSCDICKIPIETFKTLQKHFEDEHNKERPYVVCCNKKYFNRYNLVEHVRFHVDPNSFKCNICGRVLSSRKILQDHQLLHLPDEEKKFTCNECGKSFVKQNALSYHIRAFHLKKYLKMCEICGKNLRCDAFERHMLEHEGKPMPSVNCEICGLRLSGKRNLKRHMFTQHPVGGKETHTCPVCLKVSPNIIALKEHIRRVHNTEENHKCAMCGRAFKKAIALKEHMATHTGIALYTCTWCPKTFNASSSYHVHRKRQHPVEWEQTQREKIGPLPATTATGELNTSGYSLSATAAIGELNTSGYS